MRPASLALLLALTWLAASDRAAAIEVAQLEVREEGRRYVVEFEALLHAEPRQVLAVLKDYAYYPRLDPRVLIARQVGLREGKPLLYTRLRGCVGFIFCQTLDRYEVIDESPGHLVATAIPGEGDLRYGLTDTRLQPEAGGTRVRYRTEFDPSFWMPRWLVRQAMLAALRDGTLELFRAIEARAGSGGG